MTGLRLNQIINSNSKDYYELLWDYRSDDNDLIIYGIEPVQKVITVDNVTGLTHRRYALDRNMYIAHLSDSDPTTNPDPDPTILAFRVDNGVIIIVEDNSYINDVALKYGARKIHPIIGYDKSDFACINFDIPSAVNKTGLSDLLLCYEITYHGHSRIICQRFAVSHTNSEHNYNRIGAKLFYLLDNEGNIHEGYIGTIHNVWLLEMPSTWTIPTHLASRNVSTESNIPTMNIDSNIAKQERVR